MLVIHQYFHAVAYEKFYFSIGILRELFFYCLYCFPNSTFYGEIPSSAQLACSAAIKCCIIPHHDMSRIKLDPLGLHGIHSWTELLTRQQHKSKPSALPLVIKRLFSASKLQVSTWKLVIDYDRAEIRKWKQVSQD